MDDEHLVTTLQAMDDRLRTWLERSEREFAEGLQAVERRGREADRTRTPTS